jgi:hypothetical protein
MYIISLSTFIRADIDVAAVDQRAADFLRQSAVSSITKPCSLIRPPLSVSDRPKGQTLADV